MMKTLKYILMLAAVPMLWACSADEGSEPGSDPNPVVTVYCYEPKTPDLNPDNDAIIRFVTNSKTTSVKYLVLPTEDATAAIKNGGEKALLDKVEAEGVKIDDLGADSYADVTIKDLHGDYTIAAVANGSSLGNLVKFFGLDWEFVKDGVFVYGAVGSKYAPVKQVEVSLEVCTTDENLYHIKDAFGEGTALKMHMLNEIGYDDDGAYNMFRVSPTVTPLTYKDYGYISIRDYAYAAGNSSLATQADYACMMYEDGYSLFLLQWYVSAGNLGVGYSAFVPYD